MPKNWINWDDWKPGQGQQEHPESKPLHKTGKGKDVIGGQFSNLDFKNTHKEPGIRQPTDEELFGGLVVTEEQVKKAEEAWENTFSNFFSLQNKPVEKQDKITWGRGPIHKEVPTEEELRISAIPVNESDH